MPERFRLVGVARGEASDEDYRALARAAVEEFSRRAPDEAVLDRFLESVQYVAGEFDDAALYGRLADACASLDAAAGMALNRCFCSTMATR